MLRKCIPLAFGSGGPTFLSSQFTVRRDCSPAGSSYHPRFFGEMRSPPFETRAPPLFLEVSFPSTPLPYPLPFSVEPVTFSSGAVFVVFGLLNFVFFVVLYSLSLSVFAGSVSPNTQQLASIDFDLFSVLGDRVDDVRPPYPLFEVGAVLDQSRRAGEH